MNATLNMLRKIFKVSLSVTGAGIVLAVAGCGTAPNQPPRPPSAASLVSDARASFASANSVRVTGHFRAHGHAVTLDVSMFWSGAMKGTIKERHLNAEVLRVGGRSYLYLSKALFSYFRRSHNIPVACALMCGKWVRVSGKAFSGFSLKSLERLIDRNAPKIRNGAHQTRKNRKTGKNVPVPRVRLTTFDGQPAWELTAGRIEVFIAENSGRYLLGMVKPKLGVLRFSEWNAVPPIRAPEASQVISFG